MGVFLTHLIESARRSVQASDADRSVRKDPWSSLRSDLELVITVPNGWARDQRAFVRHAAVGVMGIGTDPSKVMFVTEAEVRPFRHEQSVLPIHIHIF